MKDMKAITKEDLNNRVKSKKSLLDSGDITNNYQEILMNVDNEELSGKADKGKATVDKLIHSAMISHKVVELHIEDLSESPKNHFHKPEGEKREELKGSLSTTGQIYPIIVRPADCVEAYRQHIKKDFEILIGHSRVDCLKELGQKKVKAIVVNCNDLDATLLINQSNIQRDKVTEIELARAYKETYDTYKQSIGGNDKVEKGREKNANAETIENTGDSPNVQNEHLVNDKARKGTTRDMVAAMYGISPLTLQRKMALANCSEQVIELYEKKKLTQEQIQYISKMNTFSQDTVCEVLREDEFKNEIKMTKTIAENLYAAYLKAIDEGNKSLMQNPIREIYREEIKRLQELAELQKQATRVDEKIKKDPKKSAKNKTAYYIDDSLFPDNLKGKVNKTKYIKSALSYIKEHNIDIEAPLNTEKSEVLYDR